MSAVLASLCPAPLLCQHLRSAGRCSARQLPALLGTRSGPAATASAPLVSSRSPLRPLSWALKGRLLLHLGGLVPGCCTSGACTESVTAGADGCANSRSRESEDAKRVTAPQLVGILLVLVPRPSLNLGITLEKGRRFAEGQERLREVSFTNSTAFDPQPPAVHQLSPAKPSPPTASMPPKKKNAKRCWDKFPSLSASGQEQLSLLCLSSVLCDCDICVSHLTAASVSFI